MSVDVVVDVVAARCRAEDGHATARDTARDTASDTARASLFGRLGALDALLGEKGRSATFIVYGPRVEGREGREGREPRAPVHYRQPEAVMGACGAFLHHLSTAPSFADLTIFLTDGMLRPSETVPELVADALEDMTTRLAGRRCWPDVRCEEAEFHLDLRYDTRPGGRASRDSLIRLRPASKRPFGAWYDDLFPETRGRGGGARRGLVDCDPSLPMAVAREHIEQHPRSRYRRCLEEFLAAPGQAERPGGGGGGGGETELEATHYMQRAWSTLFSPYRGACILATPSLEAT